MRVEFTPASRWDILEIADFIARDSRSAAFRYVELIETDAGH